eukprot:812184-Pleurochrysis_carterae.AAC.1
MNLAFENVAAHAASPYPGAATSRATAPTADAVVGGADSVVRVSKEHSGCSTAASAARRAAAPASPRSDVSLHVEPAGRSRSDLGAGGPCPADPVPPGLLAPLVPTCTGALSASASVSSSTFAAAAQSAGGGGGGAPAALRAARTFSWSSLHVSAAVFTAGAESGAISATMAADRPAAVASVVASRPPPSISRSSAAMISAVDSCSAPGGRSSSSPGDGRGRRACGCPSASASGARSAPLVSASVPCVSPDVASKVSARAPARCALSCAALSASSAAFSATQELADHPSARRLVHRRHQGAGGEAAGTHEPSRVAAARSALAANVPRALAPATTPPSRRKACAARAIAASSGVPSVSATAAPLLRRRTLPTRGRHPRRVRRRRRPTRAPPAPPRAPSVAPVPSAAHPPPPSRSAPAPLSGGGLLRPARAPPRRAACLRGATVPLPARSRRAGATPRPLWTPRRHPPRAVATSSRCRPRQAVPNAAQASSALCPEAWSPPDRPQTAGLPSRLTARLGTARGPPALLRPAGAAPLRPCPARRSAPQAALQRSSLAAHWLG